MLYFGNQDVKVLIDKAQIMTLGTLNKILIATNEATIPAMALSGTGGIDELNDYLTENTLTAPKLLKAVTIALGQQDVSGNKLIPAYLFVLGVEATGGDNEAVFQAIKDFDETKEADFYGIAATFEDVKFEEWAQLYAPRHLFATYTTTDRELSDKSKSDRIFGMNYKSKADEEFNHIAWLSRCLFKDELVGWKFKSLNGVTTDSLTDGAVQLLEKRGWNGYRNVRGLGQTTSSICTDMNTHIDSTYVRDTIVYNVANTLTDMFVQNEIVPMGYEGKKLITGYLESALQYCGSIGLIEVNANGGYNYEINIPNFTKQMKSLRELRGDLFTYQPNIPLEKIVVTGKEVLEWLGEV